MKRKRDPKRAIKLAKKLGWTNPIPKETLAVLMRDKVIKIKRTNDVRKSFSKCVYGSTHLSKRHYIERERSREIDVATEL